MQNPTSGVIVGGDMSKKEQGESKFRLKEKHVRFLQLLANGAKVSEAHKIAGFSGGIDASYKLRHKLQNELKRMQEDQGFSRARIVGEALKLLDLPCVDGFGRPIKGISVEQRIKILTFLESLLPERKKADPKLIPFVIVRSDSPKPLGQVIDVKEIGPGPLQQVGHNGNKKSEA